MDIEKKSWEQMSNKEKEESMYSSFRAIIGKACIEKKAFWQQNMTIEEIDKTMPYSPESGNPAIGIPSIILRTVMAINDYKEPQFLTANQAARLGGTIKKQLDENGNVVINEKTGKEQLVQGTRIPVRKNYEMVDYNPKTGEQHVDKKNPTYIDKNGKEQTNYIMYKKLLPYPKVDSLTYYHVSQFDGLDKSKFKEKDMSKVEKMRKEIGETGIYPEVIDKLERLKLLHTTKVCLENFISSQNIGIDYENIYAKKEQSQNVEMKQENTQEKSAKSAKVTKKKSENMSLGR